MEIKYKNLTIHKNWNDTDIAPLYYKYQSQCTAQPASLQLTESGDVYIDYSGEIGNAVSSRIWHRRTLSWSIDNSLTGQQLTDLINNTELLEMLNTVYENHSVDWDGNNHVGILTDAGEAASEDIERYLMDLSGKAEIYDVYDYFNACNFSDFDLNEKSTDEEIQRKSEELESEANAAGHLITGDIFDYLKSEIEHNCDND